MKGYLYILELSNDDFYIGSTTDWPKRYLEHQKGKSIYSSKFLPVKLVFLKEYPSYKQAFNIEKKLK